MLFQVTRMLRHILVFACLSAIAAPAAEPRKALFQGDSTETRWTLKELNPGLPADWTGAEFLVLELRCSTPQPFELRLYDGAETRRMRIRAFQGTWIRAGIPLKYFRRPDREGFDLASLGNKPRQTVFLHPGGPFGPLDKVQALGLAIATPIGTQTIEIRSAQLAKEDPGDAVLEKTPLVDEFGQWIGDQWPGKAKTLEDLKSDWAAEDKELGQSLSGFCPYGGFTASKARATGFFRVEQIEGRWWIIDPDGHYFFSTGADVTTPFMGTRTDGRKDVYAALPPPAPLPPGARQRPGNFSSFYTWNLQRRFGDDYAARWVDFTMRRMSAWGLNTVAAWSDARLWTAQKRAYVVMLRGWGMETGVMGMPDVYSDDFARQVDEAAARQCAARKEDPWLLGYFLANEPPWPGRELLVVDALLEGPATATQRALKAYLAEGDTPERRRAFVYQAFERFINVASAAVRKQDPNHMILGMRFGSRAPEEMIRASRIFDIYSLNSYQYEVNKTDMETANRLSGRPILIGEFHFGVPGRGMAPGLRQTRNQEERGVAYRYYVENAAALPTLVGAHWFEWVDEPVTGRMDGENYNIGLVDVTDRPYRELVGAVKATQQRLLGVHSGAQPPVSRKAAVQ
jgi:hypothetical protein